MGMSVRCVWYLRLTIIISLKRHSFRTSMNCFFQGFLGMSVSKSSLQALSLFLLYKIILHKFILARFFIYCYLKFISLSTTIKLSSIMVTICSPFLYSKVVNTLCSHQVCISTFNKYNFLTDNFYFLNLIKIILFTCFINFISKFFCLIFLSKRQTILVVMQIPPTTLIYTVYNIKLHIFKCISSFFFCVKKAGFFVKERSRLIHK